MTVDLHRHEHSTKPVNNEWRVSANAPLCDEHYRLTIEHSDFPPAHPGQFVTIAPPAAVSSELASPDAGGPFLLRRAFSIAGLHREQSRVAIDIVYRVVGAATTWMASLQTGQYASIIGPLGHPFPIPNDPRYAWLVAGGVGLPPILWLAEALQTSQKQSVAFFGARTASLIPLALTDSTDIPKDATPARLADEFSRHGVDTVLCTDDGSLGYHGTVVDALDDHAANASASPDDIVVYACGPEPMLEAVATWSAARGVQCYLCTERQMACGVGTCQSCAIPVRDPDAPEGWSYKLCCTDGPVFPGEDVLWPKQGHPAALAGGSQGSGKP